MLDENINLYVLGADGRPVIDPATGQPQMTQEGLIQAFTNPTKFASDPNMTADIVLGTVNQVSNSIDEFVTGTLQNNLLGLPLDLPALNIARGRDTGVRAAERGPRPALRRLRREPAQALYQLERLRRRDEAPRVAGQLHRRLWHLRHHHRRHHDGRQAGRRAGAGQGRNARQRRPSASMPTTS